MNKVLTQSQAAELLGVTTRRLRQRSQEENAPPQNEKGQYPCRLFGKWMHENWQRGIGVADDGTIYDYEKERARLTFHQANSAEIDELLKKKKAVLVEDVQKEWSDIVMTVRAKLLSLPSRIASSCNGKTSNEIENEAKSIIHETLTELADD